MPELARIAEPDPPAPAPPSAAAFLSLGFRPLYAAGCTWAAIAIAIWIYAPAWAGGVLAGVAWHAHEMLWGFVATVAVGFLLTASATWTGRNPLSGRPLAALALCWLAARLLFLGPGPGAFAAAAVLELAFFGIAAAALARVIVATRNTRNLGVPVLVLGLGIADALFLASAWRGGHAVAMRGYATGLLCMAMLALLVARRVIPFFAMRAVAGLKVPMHTASGHVQLAAAAGALACTAIGWAPGVAALLALTGVLALWQVLQWRPLAVRHAPLLWILYAGHAGLGAGLLVAAARAAGLAVPSAWPVHVIAMAGFSLLVIGMVTRTALGHLGRPLAADRWIVAAYGLVAVATVLRLAALVPGPWRPATLDAAALAWIAAFSLYGWRFVPLLVRPRADASVAPVAPVTPARHPVRVPVRRDDGPAP